MKTLSVLFCTVVVSAFFLLPVSGRAQFGESSTFLGPHIGLAAYESAPSFGANFETALNKPGELGDGVLGLSIRADYFSYNFGVAAQYDWSYTWITAGAYCNYHFKVGDGKFDPFVGLGLGYQNVSVDYGDQGQGLYSSSWGSGVFFAGNAGARYFFSKSLALRALLGFGVTYIVVGIDFGL
jgi:hypothetical protein